MYILRTGRVYNPNNPWKKRWSKRENAVGKASLNKILLGGVKVAVREARSEDDGKKPQLCTESLEDSGVLADTKESGTEREAWGGGCRRIFAKWGGCDKKVRV